MSEEKTYKIQDLEDLVTKIYAKGTLEGQKHQASSPETIKIFEDINTKLGTITHCLFGIEGKGGLVNDVFDIKDQLNTRVAKTESYQTLQAGAIGILSVFVIPILTWIYLTNTAEIKASINKTHAELVAHEKIK